MSNQPEKKKRGRKPKDLTTQKEKKTNSESNIILHLPIDNKFNTLLQEDKLLTYNPSVDIPQPNQTMGLNHKFSNVEFINKNENNTCTMYVCVKCDFLVYICKIGMILML